MYDMGKTKNKIQILIKKKKRIGNWEFRRLIICK